MTEKVFCPWCGGEMFYYERKKRGYEFFGYYWCRACDARAPKVTNIEIDLADLKSAANEKARRT
ncbi:MAG: hypothetical protein PHX61_13515 [Alphaproteobacteria bacterium]|nr:hypothetical protein [Alphaproteobacteria bacterium]